MKALLDSHTFLWWCEGSGSLSKSARKVIEDEDCAVSIATFWELSIKISLGKLTLPDAIARYFSDQMMENGFRQMDIQLSQIERCAALPFHHRDPFDRILAAQALEGDLSIVSRDPVFSRYGVKRIW